MRKYNFFEDLTDTYESAVEAEVNAGRALIGHVFHNMMHGLSEEFIADKGLVLEKTHGTSDFYIQYFAESVLIKLTLKLTASLALVDMSYVYQGGEEIRLPTAETLIPEETILLLSEKAIIRGDDELGLGGSDD